MHISKPPITDRKIRFAIVGCGRIANNHMESIAKHGDRCELVAVCDTDPAALKKAVESTGATGYSNLTSMLDQARESIDCVVLTTPSGLHPRQAEEVAEAGLHVMTEKPMATRWHDGLRMEIGRAHV